MYVIASHSMGLSVRAKQSVILKAAPKLKQIARPCPVRPPDRTGRDGLRHPSRISPLFPRNDDK